MTNNIDYYFGNEPYERTHKNIGKACFSYCFDAPHIKGDYITYVLPKELEVTNTEIYKYLLFLRTIPEFEPWIREPKKLVEKKEMCFSCEEKNVGVFLAFTLFRAIDEFPNFVKEIAALGTKKYPLSPLGIIRLYSNVSLINNTNHWIIGSLGKCTKEILEKPLNNKVLEDSRPFKKGIEGKMFLFMNYDSFGEYIENKNNISIHSKVYKEWKKENVTTTKKEIVK